MFMAHFSLSRDHLEALVSVSMISAGVLLLKLGGYGLLCVLPVLGKLVFVFSIIWTVLSLVDGLFITLFCIWHSSAAYSTE